MPRGRPRLFDATIPDHIDQAKIPRGAYWSRADKVWYTIIQVGEKKKRQKLADADAKMSDLHRQLEDVSGVQRGTVGWLCDLFHATDRFTKLAVATQIDYASQRNIIAGYTTKIGTLSTLKISGLSVAFIQRVIDKIGVEYPSKANHLLRYLRRVFSWGVQRGYCESNPGRGVEQAKERKRRRLPPTEVHVALLNFAQTCASRKSHSKGSIAPSLWIAMELAYLCRLRGIEVLTLTDANEVEDGVITNRRKGSRDSLILWSPRLRHAWRSAQDERERIWQKNGIPTPIKASLRPVLVNQAGAPITRSGMNTVWRTFMLKAIYASVITEDQRFGLHDLKRKGITDTVGTRAEKQEGSGHRSASMMDVYDLSIPEVTTPGDV